ncbi:MAG: ribonuclease HI family protein [Candidatus Shapirobacteria bacterium]|jgi:ribonuclease HI|nr:ribonuclease HI family protein [Candidatus Shapirobacteria bacterium]
MYNFPMQVNVYTDGGSRGNPGHSGYGIVVYDDNQNILFKESKYLGIKTNNEAEYAGLVGALTWIKENKKSFKISQINFFADSQLMIRQMQGFYKVKAPNLIPIFKKAKELTNCISLPIIFQDLRRESNILADELANKAMDLKS